MKKPDAITMIPKESFKEIIWGLPVSVNNFDGT